eukprot:TRINITY_DN13175_c0_g1_i3.p1 TRINITY_DN13175_c0_g1~~TRINITY_DN13175_c0_g1_i3.p1  ORF type:complete len:109 (+),score=18.36 TRINITY_DN13175_c0_g1_i3:68-394(+)
MMSSHVLRFFFFLMIRRPPRSTLSSSSAASDVYKRQCLDAPYGATHGNPTLAVMLDTTNATPSDCLSAGIARFARCTTPSVFTCSIFESVLYISAGVSVAGLPKYPTT